MCRPVVGKREIESEAVYVPGGTRIQLQAAIRMAPAVEVLPQESPYPEKTSAQLQNTGVLFFVSCTYTTEVTSISY